MIETIYSNPDELYHHGVKGMKWGVRRFQNPDGTLNRAGRKKYAKEMNRQLNAAYRLHNSEIRKSTDHFNNTFDYQNQARTYKALAEKHQHDTDTKKYDRYTKAGEQYTKLQMESAKNFNASQKRIGEYKKQTDALLDKLSKDENLKVKASVGVRLDNNYNAEFYDRYKVKAR